MNNFEWSKEGKELLEKIVAEITLSGGAQKVADTIEHELFGNYCGNKDCHYCYGFWRQTANPYLEPDIIKKQKPIEKFAKVFRADLKLTSGGIRVLRNL